MQFPGDALFNTNPSFFTGVVVDHKDLVYQEGEKLRIQFMAERDAYLYVLYHQADGQSLLIFPNIVQKANRVPGSRPAVIPASERELRIRIQSPFGREVLQVLATLEPIPELSQLVGSTKQFPAVSPQLLTRVGNRLHQNPKNWTEHRLPI